MAKAKTVATVAEAMSPEAEAAEVLEQMREAGVAPEPGEAPFTIHDVIHKGDATLPAPIVHGALESAGYSWIYDSRTGDRSLCNRNMLPVKLRQKREDGSSVFTLRDPGFRPKAGTFKCMLHADDPNREEYDAMGLPVCPKSNLKNPFQVRRHMQTTHKQEWQAIEEAEAAAERAAETEFRRVMIQSAMGSGGTAKR